MVALSLKFQDRGGQFVELAKYDWDVPSDETEAEIVPDLSPTATFDLDEDQKWDFPKAA